MSQPENQENLEIAVPTSNQESATDQLRGSSAAIQGNYAKAIDFQNRIADGEVVNFTAYGLQTSELIQKLGQLIAEDLQSAPAPASIEQLVERLHRDKRIERMIQVNSENAIGFQRLVTEGGTAQVGIHLHNFDVEKLEQVLKAFWKSLQATESPNNLPRSGVARFSGRDQEIEQLHNQLQKGDSFNISAIAGMGGVGKTELAIQYAKTFQAAYPAGMCWLLAREMNIGTQIVGYALVHLALRVPDGMELIDQVRFCWQNWPAGNALIILDDVTSYTEIEPYLPPENSRFKLLLTTRLKFGPPVQTLPLGVLAPEKSLELLEVLVGKERVEAEFAIAQSLCEWLGHLPLGLELVGRYLASMEDLSISELLFRLQQRARLRTAIEDEALDAEDSTWTLTAKRGIKANFELSWEILDEKSRHLGKLLSLFALAPIPWGLAEEVEKKHCEMFPENGEFVPEEFRKARNQLLKLHLLQVAGQNTYQLHSLIREFFRNKLEGEAEDEYTKQRKREFCSRVVEKARQLPDYSNRKLIDSIQPIVSHLAEVATQYKEYLQSEDLVWPFISLGNFYIAQGDYTQAERWFRDCLKSVQERLGNKHSDTAVSLSNLAYIYDLQGRYVEAESLYLQALELDRELFGEESPSVPKNLNNLAYLYDSQGRHAEAEPLYLQALELNRRLLGENHPDIAGGLSNLATLYHAQGRYEEAASLYIQALKVNQELLGEEHPAVASSLNNLANLYYSLGDYSQAEYLYLRTLELRRQLFGEEHPDVATSLNNLAALYRIQKRYSAAESLYLQALELRSRTLGRAHPDTATSLNNLAALYEAQGRYTEAEPLYLQALQLRQELLGNNHPSIATSLNNLGSLYYSQNRYEEAEGLLLQSLELQKRILGNNHPDIVTTLNNLAELYRAQGHNLEAGSLFAEALELSQRFLGEDHPISAKLRRNLEAVR